MLGQQHQAQQGPNMQHDFNLNFANIGVKFSEHFYTLFDTGRQDENMKSKLRQLYHPLALLTFEGSQFQGQDPIMTKIQGLPFQKIGRTVTMVDSQPLHDGKVMVSVIGLMQTEGEEKPLPFSDAFILAVQGDTCYIMNHIFRLALHNVPVI